MPFDYASHWMPLGANYMIGGPGYKGKGYIRAGIAELKRTINESRLNEFKSVKSLIGTGFVKPRTLFSHTRDGTSIEIFSNVNEGLKQLHAGIVRASSSILHRAGRRARERSLQVYLNQLKGTESWGTPSDTTHIPSAIQYNVTTVGDGNYTMFFGASGVKAWANEFGLSGANLGEVRARADFHGG